MVLEKWQLEQFTKVRDSMGDLISRKALLDEILLIEKELSRDKEDARNSDDEQMLFAIDNQMNALWRARCKIINQHIAYDVDMVINKLESKMFSAELHGDEWSGQTVDNLLCMGDVYEILKGEVKDD